jgi:hypothetical protein
MLAIHWTQALVLDLEALIVLWISILPRTATSARPRRIAYTNGSQAKRTQFQKRTQMLSLYLEKLERSQYLSYFDVPLYRYQLQVNHWLSKNACMMTLSGFYLQSFVKVQIQKR